MKNLIIKSMSILLTLTLTQFSQAQEANNDCIMIVTESNLVHKCINGSEDQDPASRLGICGTWRRGTTLGQTFLNKITDDLYEGEDQANGIFTRVLLSSDKSVASITYKYKDGDEVKDQNFVVKTLRHHFFKNQDSERIPVISSLDTESRYSLITETEAKTVELSCNIGITEIANRKN